MKQTPAYLFPNAATESERQILLDYLATDDHRTDSRPDVRSKHPRWDEADWPKHILESAMTRVLGPDYVVEEVTFRQDRIGLKLHTDDGNPPGAVGKTFMLLLDAEPRAETVFFKNYWLQHHRWGAFFTREAWNPYQYQLSARNGELIKIADLRDLLRACEQDASAIDQFDVTDQFVDTLRNLIQKRSLPKLDHENQTADTGYAQPGLRIHDYDQLSNLEPGQGFDAHTHAQYLAHIDIQDLEGLTIESIISWEPGAALVFDREQVHCSSSNHRQKSFINIFCHCPEV
jgi:hypothetical protein